ncbi:hypothetical protein SH501x_002124 [Pirellulaceae bacterium SH501]
MPKKKKLGAGTRVSINGVVFEFFEEFTPPERSRGLTDVTTMEDDAVDSLDHDPPDYGSLKLVGMYDPDDAGDKAIEDFFDNDDINEREATIVVSYRRTGTGTAPAASTWTYNTITYTCRINKIAPSGVKRTEGIKVEIEAKVTAKPVRATTGT